MQCSEGTGAVGAQFSFAECSDPFQHKYTCQDCGWRSEEGRICRPRLCPAVDMNNVAGVSPADLTAEDTPRVAFGQTVTVMCVLGSRAAAPGTEPDVNSPASFNITCVQGCQYAGLMQCRPLKCGRFSKGTGMKVDNGWELNRVYHHTDMLQVECLPGFAVAGSCIKGFSVRCWDGVFQNLDPSLSSSQCAALLCDDGNGVKQTCGEGTCPAFINTNLERSLFKVDMATDEGIVPMGSRTHGNEEQVPHSSTLLISCLPSMSPNPSALYPQKYSDCPAVPSHGSVANFASGVYPVQCNDCEYQRAFYCATARLKHVSVVQREEEKTWERKCMQLTN